MYKYSSINPEQIKGLPLTAIGLLTFLTFSDRTYNFPELITLFPDDDPKEIELAIAELYKSKLIGFSRN